ncbi:MAG: hypothetical protein HW390_504 [Candidatus Brocadiaceae bacterium]|nr:hypothetical protein [Candidatus Brocadiaceae bacterium]
MKMFDYTVVVWKEKEGCVSQCPELGVASCGDSVPDAIQNIKDAVGLYLENAEAPGMPDDIEKCLTTKEKFTTHIEVAR